MKIHDTNIINNLVVSKDHEVNIELLPKDHV